MKETDGGEATFEHLPVMYPLHVDQLHRRARSPCARAQLDNSAVIYSIIGLRHSLREPTAGPASYVSNP